MDQEIVDYILQAQKHGLAETEIKQNLLNAGWDANMVEQSFVFARAADTHLNSGSQAASPVPTGLPNFQRPVVNQPASAFQDTHTTAPVVSEPGPQKELSPGKLQIFKKPLFWIAVAVLFLLAGGAYAYFNLVLANPVKIWQKFTQSGQQTVYQTKFDFTYSDPGQAQSSTSSLFSYQFKDIKVEFSGSDYINAQNANNPESNSNIQYTFSSGNTSFSTGLSYILQNKVLYLNVGQNPILDMISQSANNGQKIDWIKIDLNELNKQASDTPDSAVFYQKLVSPDFKTQLQKIWEDTTLVKEDSYVGREKIDGVTTLHFKNSLDKQALKDMVNKYVQAVSNQLKGTGSEISDSDAQTINQVASQIIDKIQVQDFETWIGMTDFKLYQVRLAVNAPSFISLVNNASSFNSQSSGDSKRISDLRQMASALELYFNDNNGYPDAQNGQPIGLAPQYIGVVPTAPPTEGNCSDFYNTYWYQPMGTKTVLQGKTVYSSYQMTFCLGSDTGGYQAGIGKLTPEGLESNIACPGTAEHCAKSADAIDPTQAVKQEITNFVSKLNFSASIIANASYSGYGKTVTVTPPASSFDILQKYQQAQQTQQASPTNPVPNNPLPYEGLQASSTN
jgi:hypothetical protein